MKQHLTMLGLALLCYFSAVSQNRPVSGVIKDADDKAIAAATVKVKGKPISTVTDAEGRFSINVPAGNFTLEVSSVGFVLKSIDGDGTTNNIAVALTANTRRLDEVVVTALGIKREKKSLGYSVQEVGGKNLTEARENNIVNSLSGRVAGLQLYKTGNGPAGSTRIVIRGNNSLGGNNQPLLVVDGVPMDNYQTANGTSEYGSGDGGNGISDINPDDVETITVLKGPAAAALYGTRGGNGVLLVTTKKGVSRKGLGVRVNSNYAIDNPLLYLDQQNQYGQGSEGAYDVKSQSSWGPKITGQTVTDWRGKDVPMYADKNDLKNFLQTEKTFTNSVDLSGGNDKTVFRLGYTNFNNKGLLPNTTLKRDMVTLRVNSELTSRLSVDAKVSYANQRTFNRPQLSGSPYNVFAQYSTLPRTVHLADMNPWKDVYGHQILWLPQAYSTLSNPYWVLNENFNNDQSDRFLTMVSLDYKFTDWLKLKLRHGMDMRNAFGEGGSAFGIWNNRPDSTGEATYNSFSGYGANRSRSVETNADFLFSANKKFNDFTVGLSAGGNQQRSTYNQTGGNTGILDLPNVYNLGSGSNVKPYSYKAETRLNSLYAFLNLSYMDYLFADVTFRNDWSSTLAPENRSFNYPSFSGSLIVSDLLKKSFNTNLPGFISFLKLRGGYAEAGNTVGAYQLYPSYSIGRGFFDAIITSPPNTRVLYDILPEIVKSQEYGIDLRFINNRIGIDFTYYKKNAYNQIIDLPTPPATGYNFKKINAGNLQNKGFEFVLTGGILKSTKGINWDVLVNYNQNTNTVVALSADIKTYYLQGDIQSRAIRILANEGEDYGNMYGRDFARTSTGQVIIDADGTPKISENKNVFLGNYQPKYNLGISNTLSYKGLSFSFLIDIRSGGKFYSTTMAYMYANGNAAGTVANREGGLIVDGVHEDGSKNATAVTAQQYWSKVGGAGTPVASLFTYDASNTRLREVTLGYSIPNKLLANYL